MPAHPEPEDEPRPGLVSFARWFAKSRFAHMEDYLHELDRPTDRIDAARVRARFLRATRHGQRVLLARLAVTVLLAAGLVATAVASLMSAVTVPSAVEGDLAAANAWLSRAAALAGSASLALLALRLAFDRYLRLIETSALLLAVQLSAARAGAEPDAPSGA